MEIQSKTHTGGWFGKVIKHGKWYAFSNVFVKSVNILLLPILTFYLTPKDYGVLNAITSISQFLPAIYSLALTSALSRFYYEHQKSKHKLVELFSTIYLFIFVYGSIAFLLLFVSSFFWFEQYLKVDNVLEYSILTFLPALLTQASIIGTVYFAQLLKSKKLTFIGIIGTVANVLVMLVLLVDFFGFNLGIRAKLYGMLIESILLFIIYTYIFRKEKLLKLVFSFDLIKELLRYSLPIVPLVAFNWVTSLSDRLMLMSYAGAAVTGLYSLGYQAGHFSYIIGEAMSKVVNPVILSGLTYDKERTKIKVADFSLYSWSLMICLTIFFGAFSKDFVLLLSNKNYEGAYLIIVIISSIYIFSMQHRYFNLLISFHKKTWVLTAAGAIAAISNIILNIIFIPIYGYYAAAATSVISTILMVLWEFYWAQRLEKVKYEYKKMITIFILFIISIYFLFAYESSGLIYKILILSISYSLIGGIIIWHGDNRSLVRKIILKLLISMR